MSIINGFKIENGVLIKYRGRKTNLIIPNSVTSIENWAFEGCESLVSITIPYSVTAIRSSAFYGCSSLERIEVSSTNPSYKSVDGNLYSLDGKTLIKYANGKKEKNFAIPNSVTTIGASAFSGCSSLASVIIPDSVTSIGACAFLGCSSLASIIIPDSVTSIGASAFNCCNSLTSITIPDSVTSIGKMAFIYCWSLASVTIPNSVTSIESSVFDYCKSLVSITIPDSVTTIGERAFVDCESLASITIPNSVTSIGEKVFWRCPNLTIYYEATSKPEGWADDWNYDSRPVVWGCGKSDVKKSVVKQEQQTTTIEMPTPSPSKDFKIRNGVLDRYIGNSETVVIPDGITCISVSAFSENHSVKHTLKSLYLPQTLEIIEAGAFIGFDTLERIVIPKSVEVIGRVAFRGCDNLTIYCERKESEVPLDWESRPLAHWNIGKRPVKWGCKIEYKRRPL